MCVGERAAAEALRHEFNTLSDLIDGRGDEELPDMPDDDDSEGVIPVSQKGSSLRRRLANQSRLLVRQARFSAARFSADGVTRGIH